MYYTGWLKKKTRVREAAISKPLDQSLIPLAYPTLNKHIITLDNEKPKMSEKQREQQQEQLWQQAIDACKGRYWAKAITIVK